MAQECEQSEGRERGQAETQKLRGVRLNLGSIILSDIDMVQAY